MANTNQSNLNVPPVEPGGQGELAYNAKVMAELQALSDQPQGTRAPAPARPTKRYPWKKGTK